jgi:hypothetical protein
MRKFLPFFPNKSPSESIRGKVVLTSVPEAEHSAAGDFKRQKTLCRNWGQCDWFLDSGHLGKKFVRRATRGGA